MNLEYKYKRMTNIVPFSIAQKQIKPAGVYFAFIAEVITVQVLIIGTFRFCTTRTRTALLKQCDVTASALKGHHIALKRAVHVLVVQNLKVPITSVKALR